MSFGYSPTSQSPFDISPSGSLTLRGLLGLGYYVSIAGASNVWQANNGFSFLGTFNTQGTSIANLSPSGPNRGYQTTIVLNNTASWISTNGNVMSMDNLPHFAMRFGITDPTESRVFVGFQNVNVPSGMIGSDNTSSVSGIGGVGITYSTSRPDTFFSFIEQSGNGQIITPTTVIPASGVTYWLDIDVTDVNNFNVYLRDQGWNVLATRAVTTVPLVASNPFWACAAIRNLGSTKIKEIDFYNLSMLLRPAGAI
jgi:hypothetical protein